MGFTMREPAFLSETRVKDIRRPLAARSPRQHVSLRPESVQSGQMNRCSSPPDDRNHLAWNLSVQMIALFCMIKSCFSSPASSDKMFEALRSSQNTFVKHSLSLFFIIIIIIKTTIAQDSSSKC